ncbi:MAG: cytochrome c [Paracoccaceae bacterium]|nr:cytochrome c [Paracoccaceae bacterium]
MRRPLLLLAAIAFAGFSGFWLLTQPKPLVMSAIAGLTGDAVRGEAVFWAAGCASCHMAPGAIGDDRLALTGGQRFATAFGTFIAPNISPDPRHGIGGWTLADFANAVTRGLSPGGKHYFPVFPYGTYTRADLHDVADLKAFMDRLPPQSTPSLPHEVSFPFNIRRNLGLWKLLFMTDTWVVAGDLPPAEARGRYLVEALGHCGECHTPRNAFGGLNRARWLGGAPDPSGKGRIPNITPGRLIWSEAEITTYLTTGFTPDYDSVGGHMAAVVDNLAHLPESDRQAIAAYLKRIPAQP